MKESFVLRLNFFAFPFTRPHYTVTSTNLQLKESHQYTAAAAAAAVPGRRRWHALSFVPLCPFQHARVKRWCQWLCFRPRQTFHLVALPRLSQIPEESILDHLDLWPLATLSRGRRCRGRRECWKTHAAFKCKSGVKGSGRDLLRLKSLRFGVAMAGRRPSSPETRCHALSLAGETAVLGTTPSETKIGKRVLFISTCKKLNPRLGARLKAASVYFTLLVELWNTSCIFHHFKFQYCFNEKKQTKSSCSRDLCSWKQINQLMSSNVAISRKSVSSQTWNYSLLSVPTIKSIELTTSESHRWNGQLFQHNCPRRNVYSNYLTTAEMLGNKVVVTTTTAIVKQAAITILYNYNKKKSTRH